MSDEYVLLIHEPDWDPDSMTPDEWREAMTGHQAFQDAVVAAGERILATSALQPITKATKITPRAGEPPLISDGPFSETREVVTGFYSFTASTPEQARELAALVPTGGWVELYPVLALDLAR
ncbi:hypothetical protein KNO15_00350 [Leifsonia shinshuensis]|uniref:YciI family protein n=1 Tax=Leifsonia shinshuensis TaxID=150026 RepID=UPI001F514C2D|nr:YciI family protein [Leifsonia shinshuensis]MCI0155153.1 hypothetical protein [Leifsonia shinshuensis]